MTRGDDEVWLGKFRTSRKRGANTAKEAPLPYDGNLMDLTSHTPLHRLGETKRLIFMAALAVTDQPKSERAIFHGKRVIGEGASFKNGDKLLIC